MRLPLAKEKDVTGMTERKAANLQLKALTKKYGEQRHFTKRRSTFRQGVLRPFWDRRVAARARR